MTKLYLDDLRPRPGIDWIVVRSYNAFVDYIDKYGVPDYISFDHDLGEDWYPKSQEDLTKEINYEEVHQEKSGYHCAKYIVDNNLELHDWNVHSMNPVGKRNIINLLTSYQNKKNDPRFNE